MKKTVKNQQLPKVPIEKVFPPLVCLLCTQSIPLDQYQRHMALHEQAEILADILALSRR